MCTREPGARSARARTPGEVRAGTHLHPFQRDPQPAPPRRRRPTFHGDGGAHRQPGSSARPGKFALSSGHCAPMAAARARALPRAAGPRSLLRALCRGAAARAAHPGREAPRPPAPLPLARRGAPAPAPPLALPRPPRPALAPAVAPALASPRPRSPGFFFPLDPWRSEVSWAV